jgi:hypothetical protein
VSPVIEGADVEPDWTDRSKSQWQGLEAPDDVRRALGDLTKVGDRLIQVRAFRAETRAASHVNNAVGGVVLAISALMATGDIKCTLADPPEEVDTRPRGPGGAMITKCFHKPAHCWDGIGNQINPCP